MSNEPSTSLIDLSKGGLPAVVWADHEAVTSYATFAALDSRKHVKLDEAKRTALAYFLDKRLEIGDSYCRLFDTQSIRCFSLRLSFGG